MVQLLAGVTLGALVLSAKGGFASLAWSGGLLAAHAEVILVGWTIQFVLGVAFWILPRFRTEPARGDERPVWLAYGLINAGVAAAVLARWTGGGVLPLARGAELAAVALFAWHAWPRVKAFGT